MTIYHYIGVLIVLFIILVLGLYSSKRAKRENDFDGGAKKGSIYLVIGAIIGALVGGSSTVGTSEVAYSYGLSAWWFTLGGGLGCLILACFFSKPLQESGSITLPEIIAIRFGNKVALVTTLLTSVGNFLTVVSQILAGIALITSFANISSIFAGIIIISLMLVYVVFGGAYSAGYVGIAKVVLICLGLSICGIIALINLFNMDGIYNELLSKGYLNLFSRGVGKSLNSGLSLILGVITTQAYLQAIITAKSYKIARKSLFICSFLIPLIGIFAIAVGVFMNKMFPGINPSHSLCIFVLNNINPVVGGIIIGGLVISVVGTGAGITLGISTMFVRNIYALYINKNYTRRSIYGVGQISIIIILLGAGAFALQNVKSLILDVGYLSMALRGAVAFAPLCFALFIKKDFNLKAGLLAVFIGPVLMILSKALFNLEVGLLVGVILSFIVLKKAQNKMN